MAKILMNHHVLAVPDKKSSADFFVNVLGFHISLENGGWIFVRKEDCLVMLGECPDAIKPDKLGEHRYFAYFMVDDVDDYFEAAKSKGAIFTSQVANKPWKMREFGIKTPDGFRIMIGQQIE